MSKKEAKSDKGDASKHIEKSVGGPRQFNGSQDAPSMEGRPNITQSKGRSTSK